MMRNLFFAPLILLCILLGAAHVAMAQTGSAAISGHVTDSSGAIIQGVTVDLQNVQQGTSFSTITNAAGIYIFPSIPPGEYSITVRKEGFKQVKLVGVVANVQANVVHDFQLAIGSVSASVEVTAGANVINTTDASVSTVVDRHFVANLPLNGRSFQSLLYLTPGVTLNAGVGATGSNIGTAGQFIVNGQRPDANYWTIDGVSGNIGMAPNTPGAGAAGAIGAVNALGGTSALISVDALQEFRVVTSTYAPEFGHTVGGQVVIESRAGTNQFHGGIFDYFRNSALDANDWFADHYDLGKAVERQNDFGGVFGGPIFKDKTFFFFSYEGLRLQQPYTQVSVVPSLAARAAAVPTIQPFFNMYPLPAPGAPETKPGSGLSNYTATFSNPSKTDAFSLRLDHQISKDLHLFARYDHAPSSTSIRGGGYAANDINSLADMTKTATAGLTWMISPEVVNDFRFNYSVSGGHAASRLDTFGGGTIVPPNGLPAPFTYADSLFAYIPAFGSGLSEYDGLHGKNYQHQFDIVDALSMQRGNHSLKFGVDYRRLSPTYGQATMELIPLFFSMASMEAGISDLVVTSHYALGSYVFQNLGLFGQDTWRVNPRLNVTYGLRWDVDYAPKTTSGVALSGLSGFNLNDLSNLALAPGTQAYHTHYGNIAPRIGGAYKVRTQPGRELVVRGGFGLFYGMASTQVVNGYAMDEPFYPYGINGFFFANPFPIPPGSPAATLPPLEPPSVANGNALFGLDPNLNLPYALEWNFALEQSLGTAQTFTMSYIGSTNKREPGVVDVVNPNPNYARAYLIAGIGTSNYSALQLQYQRRLTHGLQVLASYTWSHCIDTGSYGAYGNSFGGSPTNVNANRGDCDYDLRHMFSAALTYQFPSVKTNLFTRALTSGWSTDDIVQLFTGPPVDVTDGNFPAIENTGTSIVIRPDIVSGQPRYLTGSQYPGGKALNPAAFKDPPSVFSPEFGGLVPTRQGTLGRNSSRTFGLAQWNFALHRDFPIYRRLTLQFRAEMFNILNHPNFGAFNSNFQSANNLFGLSTQMLSSSLGGNQSVGAQSALYQPGGPRSGQLALKLIF
jgi:hypothetical protein